MPSPVRRTRVPPVLGLLAACWAANGLAEVAILQLSNLTPGAGSIVAGSPVISCEATCVVAVGLGDTVALTATPAPGNRLDAWSGDCSGSGATCTLVMDRAKLAVASFKPAGGFLSTIHRFTAASPDGGGPQGDLLLVGDSLYGMTESGGATGGGTIFRDLPDGSRHVVLHQFLGGAFDGASPTGSLIESDGELYGMTSAGGGASQGTIFRLDPDGSDYTLLHAFGGGAADGSYPQGSLLALDGLLYGMTSGGGAGGTGTIFRLERDGSGFAVLHAFTGGPGDGSTPFGSLISFGGVLYGLTRGLVGGDRGTVFRVNPDGSGFAVLHSFAGDTGGAMPYGSLLAVGGVLYGMTSEGGAAGAGTIFRLQVDGSGYALVHVFEGIDGFAPYGSLALSGGLLFGMTSAGGVNSTGTIFKMSPDGSGFAVLRTFGGAAADGVAPRGSLIQLGGALYGVTSEGGAGGSGTVFRIGEDGGGYGVVHSFAGRDSEGYMPSAALLAHGDTLYGMTRAGGAANSGTIFTIKPNATGFAVLHSFDGGGSDGSYPLGALVASGGLFYGMTYSGGAANRGAVFKVNADGTGLTPLHSFAGGPTDGSDPYGSLTSVSGVLYGMTPHGGGAWQGTIFRLDPDGSDYTLVHAFSGGAADGSYPQGSLLALDGMLYGMTSGGGAGGTGTIFAIRPDGNGFTVMRSFTGGPADGSYPLGSLIGSGGVLFGMTQGGGGSNLGTVFRVNPDGSGFAVLHSFAGGVSDGQWPSGSLVEAGDELIGLTWAGGLGGRGTIFKVNRDGTGFAVLHSFAGADGDWPRGIGSLAPSAFFVPLGSLTSFDGGLYGVTTSGGLDGGGVLFRLDLPQPRVRRHLFRP